MNNPEGIAGKSYEQKMWLWSKVTKRLRTGRPVSAEVLSGEVGPSEATKVS